MKKVEMHHPKLYLSAIKNEQNKIEATYISNRFGTTGELKEESIILDGVDTNVSIKNILIDLNKIEMNTLRFFITHQEKVVTTYKSKGKAEQLRIVSESLDLLIRFRLKFQHWFEKMECIA